MSRVVQGLYKYVCACFNCGNPYGKRTIVKHSVTPDPISRKRRRPVRNNLLAGSESHFMVNRLEELLFKEYMFQLTVIDVVDIILLEKMYKSAVKKYCNRRISSTSSSHLEVIPRERNSKHIEKMRPRMRKEDEVVRVIFTKQVRLNPVMLLKSPL